MLAGCCSSKGPSTSKFAISPQPHQVCCTQDDQHRFHITTCHHRPLYPAHRIGFAGTGKGLNAAGCCILGDVVGLQSLASVAHCRCPDYADWPATAGDVYYREASFPARDRL